MPYQTPEGLDNNYVLKLIKRILTDEYPYIKDVKIDYNDIEKYRTIFLILYVNPIEMSEYYETPFMKYVDGYIRRNEELDAVSPSIILDMSYEEGRDIGEEIDNKIKGIVNNPIIPNELKNLDHRTFGIGAFRTIPNPT